MPMYGAGFTGPKFEIKENACMTVKEQVRLSAVYARIDAALAELQRASKIKITDPTVADHLLHGMKHLLDVKAHIQDMDESIKRPRVR